MVWLAAADVFPHHSQKTLLIKSKTQTSASESVTRLVFLGERSRACDGSNPFTCKWSSRDVIPSDSYPFSLKWHQCGAAVRSTSPSAQWNYLVLKLHIGTENLSLQLGKTWCRYTVLSMVGKKLGKKMGGQRGRQRLTFCHSDRYQPRLPHWSAQ